MYLLDTDTVSNAIDKNRAYDIVQARIAAESPANLRISIITIAEMCRGWLDLVNQARKHPRDGAKLVRVYTLFQSQINDVMQFDVLPYDKEAEKAFQSIPVSVRQQHSQHCHIAAIALSRGLTVVTSNIKHFSKIPSLRSVDWTIAKGSE